jgi:hypothetical protein
VIGQCAWTEGSGYQKREVFYIPSPATSTTLANPTTSATSTTIAISTTFASSATIASSTTISTPFGSNTGPMPTSTATSIPNAGESLRGPGFAGFVVAVAVVFVL